MADAHDGGAFLGRDGPHDEGGSASIQPALVAKQRRRVGARDYAARADDGGDALERCVDRLGHRSRRLRHYVVRAQSTP
jgi:hypothetical protein